MAGAAAGRPLVIVDEKLVADDGSGPLANALVDLDMLVWTEGSDSGRRPDCGHCWREMGFDTVKCRPTAGYWSVVVAGKSL